MLAESGVSLRRIESRVTEISAFRGKAEGLAQALGLPPPGRFVVADGVTKIAYRPGCWLLLDALSDLSAFADQAAIIDQSHGKHVFALEGPQARDLLMRGCRLDLRDGAFPAGATGTTIIGQLTVTLLCDAPDSAYRLLVGASFAEALADWLRRVAAHCPA